MSGTDPGTEADVIDLLQLAKALWHRAWLIAAVMLLTGALFCAGSVFLLTPRYEATAMLYVNNSSITVGSTSVSLSDLSAAQSLVDTYVVILQTRTTLEEVIERADLDYTYTELADMIEAEAVNSTEILAITVTSTDPEEAARIANTVAEVLPERISEIVEGSSVCIVDAAAAPTAKSAPNITRNTAVGLLIGAVLACLLILLPVLTDEKIRSEDDLRRTCDLPILAAVPNLQPAGEGGAGGRGRKRE